MAIIYTAYPFIGFQFWIEQSYTYHAERGMVDHDTYALTDCIWIVQ